MRVDKRQENPFGVQRNVFEAARTTDARCDPRIEQKRISAVIRQSKKRDGTAFASHDARIAYITAKQGTASDLAGPPECNPASARTAGGRGLMKKKPRPRARPRMLFSCARRPQKTAKTQTVNKVHSSKVRNAASEPQINRQPQDKRGAFRKQQRCGAGKVKNPQCKRLQISRPA